MATLLWSITVCVMPWMVPARFSMPLRPLRIPVSLIFWTIAVLTVVFAWPVRHDTARAYGVLTVSLLLVAALFLTLR